MSEKKIVKISETGVIHVDAEELLKLKKVQEQLEAVERLRTKQPDAALASEDR